MDPNYERRLIEEVIYLHSLWHQGPPRPPQSQPITTIHQSSATRLLHHPLNPTQFKKERIKSKRKKGKNRKQSDEAQNPTQSPSPASSKEWPCNPSSGDSPATTSGWSTTWPKPNSEPLLPSLEQKAKLAANQAQFKALKIIKDYFFKSDNDESSEDDDDDFMEEDDGCEEHRFFVEMFTEDSELREYYNKNYQNGEFSCLVCAGVGKKLAGKKFKGCIALVQHSISIARTRKRRAHRAYGQAICKVLGWDIDNLSSIVSAMTEKHEESLTGAVPRVVEALEGEGDAQANVGEGNKDGLTALESKNGSADASNAGEGEAQAIILVRTKDGSTSLENKEGSTDVKNSGQGEVGCDNEGKAQENLGEGTKDSSTVLQKMEAPLDACNGGEIANYGVFQ